MAGEEEKDRVECVAADRTDFFFGDLSKCKRRAALEVDIVGKGECGQRGKWRTSEKIGRRPVFEICICEGSDEDIRHLKARGYALSRYWRRSATASRSFSSSKGSYDWELRDRTETRRGGAPRDQCEYERFERYTYNKTRSKRKDCPLGKRKVSMYGGGAKI